MTQATGLGEKRRCVDGVKGSERGIDRIAWCVVELCGE